MIEYCHLCHYVNVKSS